jgi:hypothetical protein
MCHRVSESVRPRFAPGIAFLVCTMFFAGSASVAQDNQLTSARDPEIVGIWLGTLEAEGERVRVVIKISRNAAGVLVGTMDSPDRLRKDLPINRIDWQSDHVRVEAVGDRIFIGELSKDGQELVGEWQQAGRTLPLKLGRVDRAPGFDVPFPAGLYVAAALTSFFALLIIGSFILKGTRRADWRFVATVMAVHLPMSIIAFHWLRLPVKGWLAGQLEPESALFAFLDTCFAPLTEEPAKLWLLLFPWFRARLRQQNAPYLGLAIGLGFGISEAWMVAGLISGDPQIAGIPWYGFGTLNGFMTERFMVCIHHGVFTAAALRLFHRAPLRGILCAMGLHYLGNFPIALKAWNVGNLGQTVWGVIVQIWILLFFFGMLVLLNRFLKSADPEWRGLRHHLLGRAKCPECGLIYERPWMAVNLGTRRYERCPGCLRWHYTTTLKDDEPLISESTAHVDQS